MSVFFLTCGTFSDQTSEEKKGTTKEKRGEFPSEIFFKVDLTEMRIICRSSFKWNWLVSFFL